MRSQQEIHKCKAHTSNDDSRRYFISWREILYQISQSGQGPRAIRTRRVSMQYSRKLPVTTASRLNRMNLDRNVTQLHVLSTPAEKKNKALLHQRRMSRATTVPKAQFDLLSYGPTYLIISRPVVGTHHIETCLCQVVRYCSSMSLYQWQLE